MVNSTKQPIVLLSLFETTLIYRQKHAKITLIYRQKHAKITLIYRHLLGKLLKRLINYDLTKWRQNTRRKPLIMRGARQVGKTHAVRKLSKEFTNFVEINFEKQAELSEIFAKNLEPKRILNALTAATKQKIIPGETLLFFDEIQVCPQAITALRYFYEEMPTLHVIAAGSLLDFAIEEVGVPVGRVSYCYMYPMSFIEYLIAVGHSQLIELLLAHSIEQALDEFIHQKLFDLLGEYMLLGGMPEVISEWIEQNKLATCSRIQHEIVNTYRDDFPKYAKKIQIKYAETLFTQIPHRIAAPFKYSHIDGDYQKRELKPALELLIKAGIVHKVEQTAGRGIPLGAEVTFDKYKLIFLDMALTQTLLGNPMQDWLINPLAAFINKGPLTEAFVGQEFLAYSNSYEKRHLYYWQRQQRGSTAEVDYLIQKNEHIIPIEVKSGKGTTLKSLHLFLESRKNSPYGIRLSTHNFSIHEQLHSYPLYAIVKIFSQTDPELMNRLGSLLED